jgi:apolipoprotein N-acyltransferase
MPIARLILRYAITAVLLALGLACLFAFHQRYWIWRRCFNELGRCFDPDSMTVYSEWAAIWGVLGGLFLVAGYVAYAAGRSRDLP